MATTKSKKTAAKKSSTKPKTTSSAKTVKTVSSEAVAIKKVDNTKPLKGFFACKYDANENILTIFKCPRIWGALMGELIGSMLITMLLLTLGIYQPLYIMFGILAITIAIYALSGAHINPIISVGAMATRRVSVIRGILYIIAQVVGAWLALIIVNAFAGNSESATLPTMAAVEDGQFWTVTMIEFLGATIIGFFFARAFTYKRSAFTFAAIVSAGTAFAILIAIVISSNYLGLQNNFVLNPAVAIMYQIIPNAGDSFGQLLGDIALALTTYVIFPMLGGVVGFYVADFSAKLSGEALVCEKCEKK